MTHDTVDDILSELDAIQDAAGRGHREPAALERAIRLVGHEHNDVRWQALIAVGEWIGEEPESVWPVVLEHGASADEDMRNGVATVLLEHVLEHHFDTYFPLLRERIAGGAPLLADTLRRCGAFGDAKTRWNEVDRLLREA